jgi:endo-1,4-beta-D-glucanase Y
MDADVQAFYAGWKAKLLKTFTRGDVAGESYVSAGANGAIEGWPPGVKAVTQSEGHAYAMLVTALMAGHDPNAKKTFDSLDRVRRAFPSSSDARLMSWAVPGDGKTADAPQAPATDGDMDMAYALLLANSQWGDEARNHYLAEARSIIAGMEDKFITAGAGKYFPRMNTGDPRYSTSAPPESKPYMTRPSDFMIDHMLTFRAATGHAVWGDVANGSANILLAVRNQGTGLVPDFVVADPPVPSTTGTADEDLCYQCFDYNSCRVPWRQAVAVALFGFPASRDVASRMVTWARTKYRDTPSRMSAVFKLDGSGGKGGADPAFTSPMVAAGITDPAAQAWLDRGWAYMARADRGDYYGASLTLMSMILVSGNWWIPGPAACPQGTRAQRTP